MAQVTPETELAAPVPVQGMVLQQPTVQVPPGAAAGTVMPVNDGDDDDDDEGTVGPRLEKARARAAARKKVAAVVAPARLHGIARMAQMLDTWTAPATSRSDEIT